MKDGWRVVPLGDVASFVMGQAPPGAACNFDGVGTPFVKAGEFGPDRPIIREWTTDPKKFAKATDVLICVVGATCGKINLGTDCAIGRSVAAIRPQPAALDQFFLHYFLEGQVLALRSGSLGAAQTVISKDILADLPIPLPPLDEQKRIVAVLDEAFEGLSRARANAEANLADARELFETSLSVLLDRYSIDWTATTLGAAYDVRDGTHDSPKYQPSGRPLITSKNLGRDGLHFEKVSFISEQDFEAIRKRSEVHRGDVLFAMIGTIGNPIVVDVDPDFAIKNVALFKMKGGRVGTFLRFVLRSKTVVEKMKAEAKGTTQQFVGLGYLRSFPLSLPPPESELDLVELLEELESGCRKAESVVEERISDLDTLRLSLLQKAFSGELT